MKKITKALSIKHQALLNELTRAKTVQEKALVNAKISKFVNDNFLSQKDLVEMNIRKG